ncbi:hemerythrin domain-containing protein [Dactylosporangium sp. CA-139066]|uniref:hemerythrin domain-containing protein n=1 Tax=Dactylosporangium sp. CA-139066 TaxID=3239930 RepID=UPI003D8F9CCC
MDQIRLPGQAATAEGPNDLTGMFTMHWGFRRDLDRFAAAAAGTPVDDRAAWRALAGRWAVFERVLHDHHTGEDEGLWPALAAHVERAGTPAERAVLDAMTAEHHGIDPALTAVAEGFARLAAGAGAEERAAVHGHAVAARDLLARHLAHEEGEALELVQRYLSHAEWEHIERVHFRQSKSPRAVIELLAWVLHDLPAHAAARLFSGPASGSGPLLLLWRAFLRRPFARREAAAFRYA